MSADFYKANSVSCPDFYKSMKAIKRSAIMLVFFAFLFTTKAFSATKTPLISGNWSSIATWGGALPAPGDDIIINDGTTLTVDGNYTCKSVGFSGAGGTSTLNVNAGFQLTVTTDISCPVSTADVKINANYVIGGLGSISCMNFNVNNNLVPTGSNTTTVTAISTISNMLISGDLVINSTVNQVNKTNNGTFNLQKGTVTIAGTITTINVANANTSTIDMVTGAASPTLVLSGPTPFNLMNKGNSLLNANGTGATVNYSYNGDETVLGTTNGSNTIYNNLILSGSGVKKLSNGITVNGTLSMQGTVTTSGSTPTYGTSATLEYKGSTAQTTSDIECPVLGTPAPNLRIDNLLGVTLNDNKKVTGTLSFVNGLLSTGTNKISLTTTGTVSGAGPGKYIYGNEEIFYANTLNPSEKFDIGDATTYAPATVAFSGTTTGSGSLTAYTSAGDHTDIDNSGILRDTSVNRTWTITKSGIAGFTSYDATFNYDATDLDPGANSANFIVRKLSGTWGTTNLVAANALSTEANGMTSFGTFQVGEMDVLAIDVQPNSHPGCLGYSTTFSFGSGSLPAPTVKWQRADASGLFTDITSTTDGGVYTNFTSSTLIISNVTASLNNYRYRAILTNINGTVTSNDATLTYTVPPSAAISYSGTPFCTTMTTGQPVTQTGTTGGTYSSVAGLSLDGVAGSITPSSSAAGSYIVSYTIDAFGGCPTYTVTTPVTITAAPSAAIYYAGSPFCTTVSTAQPVTRTGNTGGTYSSTAGLIINSATGAITPSSSTPGTYTVTYTVPAANGCAAYSTTTIVNITQAPAATISYAGSPFCVTDGALEPVTRSGTTTGIFSAPSGLSIDPTNGDIMPSSSTPGTYTVTYTVSAYAGCAAYTTTTSVTIAGIPSATISYAGSPFCTSIATAQNVTLSGTAGGTYSSTPGLSINSSTGAITPSTSTQGTYTVTYTVNAGACGIYTFTTTVTITAASAMILYDQSPFCSSDPTPQNVTLTGNPGGAFSSTAGLSIDPSTGDIVPATSTPGTYTVTYFVAAGGGCASFSTTTSVTVTPAPYALISYTASAFCTTVALNQAVKRTGNASGTYTASPTGLTISSTTGVIKPSTSTPGTYTVTYTVPPAGGCGAFFATTTVTITAAPSGTISYAGSPFCKSVTGAQAVTQTATTGGTFSAPAGLSIDATTGSITPSASTPGTYTVTYSIPASGGCAAFSTNTSVIITQAPSATISYGGTPFCTSLSGGQSVTRTGTAGGTYSSSAGLTISAATGAITASSSTDGTYTVTYTIAASGGCAAFTTTTSVTITAAPSATISYTGNPFCASVAGSISVTRTGTAGGTFSAPAGLSMDATTGAIIPSTSTPGTYTVTYSIAASGGCAAYSTTASVTITQVPSATISYGGTPFCTSLSGGQAVTRTGTAGGTYSSSAGLIISAATGAITASSSTAGTYTVTYAIAASGGCAPFSTTTSVTITTAPTATISYTGNPFCTSVAGSISVTRTGTTGGAYSSSAGLSIDAVTGAITPSTSTAGTYTVTYSIGASGGCAAFSTTTSVTITKAPSAAISYAGTPFCTSVTSAQPATIAGSTGGTFSSTAGLSINAATGAITPSSSTAGTYTVTYKIAASGGCSAFTTTTSVVITIGSSATITYAGSPFCKTVTTAQAVTQSGTAGGTYSSTPGLSISATTGAITPSTSTAGTYIVSYLVPAAAGCGTYSTTASVTITAVPSASISYSGSPYCKSITTAQAVTRTGNAAGTYSSTAGLSINAATGAIAPSASTAGTYTVTYTVAASGGCAAFSTATSVTITTAPSASISYTTNPFCKTVATAQAVTQTGTTGGTYSSTTGLTINSTTGAITPSTSTPGTYTVTYTIPASAACAVYTATTSVTITSPPSATIAYSGTPFCNSITTAQPVTQTGTFGGTYSSTAGLSINATTGAITPSASTAGTYTVTYTIAVSGGCAAYSTTTAVTITAAPSAVISYSPGTYCTTAATAQAVTRTGTAGGTYSSTAGLSINASTGGITPSLSIPGTYTVTYFIAASAGCAAYSTTTTVAINTAPSASISYSGSPFCTTLSGSIAVTQTGATGGTYSSTAGLSINATTGAIMPSASTAGTYTVTYTVPTTGGCAAFSTVTTVTIVGSSATISYSTAPFCTTVTTAQAVTRTGTSGGTFSSTTGLSITAAGSITPSTSTPGTYTVSYTLPSAGGCGVYVATTTVTITQTPSATISYATNPFCSNEGDQPVTLTGTAGGVFSSTAGLSINSSTGAINPSLSTAGTYTVKYTIAASGGCAAFSITTSVTVTQANTATISYAGNPFCETSSGFASVTLTGATGGTFSASPSGLSMDASGTVKMNKSIRGDYVVSYTIAATGGCAAFVATTPFNINQAAVATIGYPGTTVCSNTTTPQAVTLTGDVGGTFTATSGLNVDAVTGAVTPYPSPAGTYTVTYVVANGCGSFTTSATVTIKTAPFATISYAGSPYCGALSASQPVTRTGTAGGTYSSTPGLTIDANTGAISPFESSAGTYSVTYTVTNAGSCPYYATTSVTIYSISSSSITYDAPAFCNSDNTLHAVIQDGATNGTFSAPAGLDIDPTTGGITPSSSTPGNYTVTYTVPAVNSCPSYKAFAAVTITEIPSATMDFTGSPYCSNGGTASVTLEGTSGGVFSSTPGLVIDPVTGTITLGTSKVGTHVVNYDIAASGGCEAFSVSAPVEIDLHAIWNGSVSRNWHDPNNWSCGGVPTLISNAVIPSGLVNYPIIYSGIGTTHDITIQTGATIIDSGALTIAGTIYNSDIGSINALAGKVEFAATAAEVIPSSLFYSKTIQDLVLSNPAGVTLKGPLRVTGSVAFGNVNNCVFTTGDSLTLASVATSDAQVKDITNNGVNSGNVISGLMIIERYMPPKRAYRFLTAPVNSSGSIKANWMENALNPDRWNRKNPFPGYGTNITGAGDVANGFDPTSTHNPSMFTFNSQLQAWVPIPNTSGIMSAGNAYRIIVRGDRDIDMNTNTPTPTPTTLRATGKVVTGNVTFVKSGAGGPSGLANLSPLTGAYNLVANPYPSAIDWLTVTKTDMGGSIWIFDPNVAGINNRGGYVTYNTIIGTTVPGSSVGDNYIQSGQAFFVQTAGPNPSITFKETDKASVHRSLFRTANTDPNLSVQLILPWQEGTSSATDGFKVFFADAYSNSVSREDSYKLSNQDENIAITRDKSVLSIEGRKPVIDSDTIPIKMWQLAQNNYLLKVNFNNFADNVEAFLEDKYLRLTSPLSTHGETTVPVNINSDAASFASDRFKIVFEAYATLPLHLLGVKAVEKNNGVDVSWIAESENNMERYEVEKSADGQLFVTAGTVKAKGNPGPSSNYSWFDLVPFEGDNYYRIKSVDRSGSVKYSSVVKVRITKGISGITVFPNPIHGKVIAMRFSNIKQGNYIVRLINSAGEKMYEGIIVHDRGSFNHSLELKQVLPSGVYQMTISNSEDIENIRIVIQ